MSTLPYAAPPVGDLRWRPPREHKAWNDTLDVSAVPEESECPQLLLISGLPFFKGSEQSCLTLSVYSPASARPGRRSTSFPRIRSNALGDPMHHQNSVCRVPLVSGVTFSSFLQLEYSRNISTGG